MKDQMSFESYTLTSGLRLHYQHLDVPWIRCAAQVRVGNRYDPPGKEALTHLLEHHLLAGTKGCDYQGLLGHFEYLARERLQTIIGVQTGNEFVQYCLATSASNSEKLFRFMSRFLLEPALASDLRLDQEIVKAEGERKYSRERWRQMALARGYLYGTHRLATVSPFSSEDGLFGITPDDVRDHHRTYFCPSNLELVVIGGLPSDELLGLVDGYFGAKGQVPQLKRQQLHGVACPRVFEYKFSKEASRAEVAYRWIRPQMEDLLEKITSTAMTRMLTQVLREEKRFVYGVAFGASYQPEGTVWTLSSTVEAAKKEEFFAVTNELLLKSGSAVKEILPQMVGAGLFELELQDLSAKKRIEKALKDLFERGRIVPIEEQYRGLQSFSLENVSDFLQGFTPDSSLIEVCLS